MNTFSETWEKAEITVQCKWNHDSSGYYTRMLTQTVGVTLFFRSSRDIGISYCSNVKMATYDAIRSVNAIII